MKQFYLSSYDLLWRFWNRISYTLKPRELGRRQDTYPYLSSDGYALRSCYRIERNFTTEQIEDVVERLPANSVLYIPGHLVHQTSLIVESRKKDIRKVIIADDDDTQNIDSLRVLIQHVQVIQSVNLVELQVGLSPLPLGLESPSYRSGGRLIDFKKKPSHRVADRPISFLVAWNPNTNNSKRSEAISHFKSASDTSIYEKRITARSVHKLMRRSLFVPCPRGNGVDSHRIWEAIYLGSIPVVLKEDSFPALIDWPIWIVDSWSEVINHSRLVLEAKYKSLVKSHSEIMDQSMKIYGEVSK